MSAALQLPSLAPLLAALGPPPPRVITAEAEHRRASHITAWREGAAALKASEAAWGPRLAEIRRELDDGRLAALPPAVQEQRQSAQRCVGDIIALWSNAGFLASQADRLEALPDDRLTEEDMIRFAERALPFGATIAGQLARLGVALSALAAAGPSPQP